MTHDCGPVQDRMPRVAAGRDAWTPEEAAALAGCAECSAEWWVVATAARLGADAAGRVDPRRLTAVVLEGVARDRQWRRWRRVGWLTGVAAAAALVLVVARPRQGSPAEAASGDAPGFHLPLAELEAADEGALETVLEQLDAPVGDGNSVGAPALGDLDDTQLERVLRSLEG